MTPIRVQRKRTKGWKMPADTVCVTRPSKWGNPFVPGRTFMGHLVADKRHAFVLFRTWAPMNEKLVEAARLELAGKHLACWCAHDDPYEDACHAAVLIEIANPATEVAL